MTGGNLARLAVALSAAALFNTTVSATPIEILNWKPVPETPGFAEINYTGANLTTDVGAIGTGDGNLPVANQAPGGLQVDTIFSAPIPFSYASGIAGGTGYYDTTLLFTGLAPIAPAVATPIGGGLVLDAQALGAGTFTITSTAPAGSVVILQGIIGSAALTGLDGGSAGAVFSAHSITYTGGLLYPAINSAYTVSGNDMSISMTSVIPAFGIGRNGFLNPFKADATGLFDANVVPEPSTLCGMALLAPCALGVFRRRLARK